MFKFINKRRALQWFLLAGLLGFSVYTIIMETEMPNEQGAAFLFQNFTLFFNNHVVLGKGVIISILLIQIILIQLHFKKNEYTAKKTLFPACFYLSILLLTKSLHLISPLFFTLLFFLIIISIDYNVNAIRLKNSTLIVGMLIATATCFDISSIVLLFLSIIVLIINHFSKIKEIGILVFGFVLIYFYFFSYYFLFSDFQAWWATFKELKILGILGEGFLEYHYAIPSLIGLCIIYSYFILRTKLINDSKVVVQRKRMVTFNLCATLLIFCIFISHSAYPHGLGYLFVPISVYLAILSQEKNPFYVNELITIITFVALYGCFKI